MLLIKKLSHNIKGMNCENERAIMSIAEKILESMQKDVVKSDDPDFRKVIKLSSSVQGDDIATSVYMTTVDAHGFNEKTVFVLKSYLEKFSQGNMDKLYKEHNDLSESTFKKLLTDMYNETEEVKFIMDKAFSESPVRFYEEDGLSYIDTDDEIASEAEASCYGYFCTAEGYPIFYNIFKFSKFGYDIYAGDKDSFGWVTGCVEKDGKVLVFG